MTAFRVGTMGFSYSDWEGVFYPPRMKPGEYLSYYARCFDAVELDTTFHATPPPERVRRWADATPAGFRFSVKTPKAITHEAPIDRGIDPMKQFLDVARQLGPKLAVVLIQFPPTFGLMQLPKLATFLESLPRDVRFAVEFRHPAWQTDETESLLREHRIAWVAGDYMDDPPPVCPTTDFLYLRWIGIHGRFSVTNREQLDVTDRLKWWVREIRAATANVNTVWSFFSDDYAGYAIGTANRFKRLVGQPVIQPPREQGELFGR